MSKKMWFVVEVLPVAILGAIIIGLLSIGGDNQAPDKEMAIKQFEELVLPICRIRGKTFVNGMTIQWSGSGVVIYSEPDENDTGYDTYVLTCNHVVETPILRGTTAWNAEVVDYKYQVEYVELFDRQGNARKVLGQVVCQSNNNVFSQNDEGDIIVHHEEDAEDWETGQLAGEDLALVRLFTTNKIPAVKVMPKEKIDELKVFFKARVVGCSLGGRPYHTFGEITLLEDGYMSVNAQFVPGNSGGAAFLDKTHEFIGITNAGPRGVWHMGLIRPLREIYDWLAIEGYDWVYHKNASEDRKFRRIRLDRDEIEFALRDTLRTILFDIEALKREIEELELSVVSIDGRLAEIERIRQQAEAIARTLTDFLPPAVPTEAF